MIAALLVIVALASPLVDALATDDPRALDAAVAAVEAAPADADALYTAARACEDKLHDPGRAFRLYVRIERETPDARVATAASRRREALALVLGPHGEHAREAAELAQLVATADTLDRADVERRADALARVSWPGADAAALWVADWLRLGGHCDEAWPRYDKLAGPDATRGAAGCALDLRDWGRAEELARSLPAATPSDALVRDDLLARASRGRLRGRAYPAAWIVLALVAAGLGISLATARPSRRALRPPLEIAFAAPIAAVLVAVAFTANRLVAPAVGIVAGGGLVLAWLSAAGLDAARAKGRSVRRRAIVHVLACVAGVVALGYIAVTRDGLLDMLVETVRFGPEV